MKKILAAVIAALVPGCILEPCPPPRPPPEPAVVEVFQDASTDAAASPCGKACASLAKLGCPEARPRPGTSCYRGCLSMLAHQEVPTSCWAAAATVEEARACGGLRCEVPK